MPAMFESSGLIFMSMARSYDAKFLRLLRCDSWQG